MSDAESLNSDESESTATVPKILSAVKSYLLDRSLNEKPHAKGNDVISRDSGYIRRMTERTEPINSGVDTPAVESMSDVDESQLRIIHDNNLELAYIRDILYKSVPDALNETLLLVVEERSRRERIEAELQAVRERWQYDVSELRKIIEAKSQTISHLIRLNAGVPNVVDSSPDLEVALAEIERLRTIIRQMR